MIPMDAENRPLMPQSSLAKVSPPHLHSSSPLMFVPSLPSLLLPSQELWPLILAKGVCTIAALTYDIRPHTQEFGHADVMQMLTGRKPARP